jgi:hypothetical protein
VYNVYEYTLFPEENASGAISGTVVTRSWKISRIFNHSLQLLWSDGPVVGSANIEVSLNNVDWSAMPNSSLPIAGSSGNHIWSMIDVHVNFVRLKFNYTSGSGTFKIIASGKGW